MLEELLALISPPACGVCGAGCEVGRRLCERCGPALRNSAPVWSSVPGIELTWSAASYDGVARQLVAALKFRARLGLAQDAAALIAARAPTDLLVGSVVPVPAAPARRRRRGFDAAEGVATALARRCGLSTAAPCLSRAQSPRQVGRRRAERLADPPRVSAVSPAPDRVVLVDDVMTTGATLAACARALRGAGATQVVAVTIAASRPAGARFGPRARAA